MVRSRGVRRAFPDARNELTHEELLAVIAQLDVRARGLQAQRRDVTYRLEQLAREKQRLHGHLEALGRTA
jgi:hypothetical protein